MERLERGLGQKVGTCGITEASDQSKDRRGRVGGCPGGDEGTCALMPCRSLTGKIHPLERVLVRGGYLNLTCLRGWDLMAHFQGFSGFPPTLPAVACFCKLTFAIASMAASACGSSTLVWEGESKIMSRGERSLAWVYKP